ncbi:hypothetical protein RRG08_033292 [Elysia crispata]|uniref:Phospholipid scramblase n=1 Tax=Elysia crispata TaxID=231223 RepID=A0AAE0XRM1_9GAST|nr:hypothetical protein RRG08_033292 [Elysia crispata]
MEMDAEKITYEPVPEQTEPGVTWVCAGLGEDRAVNYVRYDTSQNFEAGRSKTISHSRTYRGEERLGRTLSKISVLIVRIWGEEKRYQIQRSHQLPERGSSIGQSDPHRIAQVLTAPIVYTAQSFCSFQHPLSLCRFRSRPGSDQLQQECRLALAARSVSILIGKSCCFLSNPQQTSAEFLFNIFASTSITEMSQGAVISEQPQLSNIGGFQPMAFPGQIPGVPSGLEYLTAVDQLIIKQEVSVFELVTELEAKNKYRILNSVNQQAYWAFEESALCNRICCGPDRGFIFHITDNSQQEVMTITRDFRCCAGCPCCADGYCFYPIYVHDRFGQKLGMTRQLNYCCTPHMGIFDENDTLLYEITGPCCVCQTPCCRDDVEYPIINAQTRSEVGMIKKVWTDVLRECFTDVTTFSLTFPLDLDVKHKALMLSAVFLVDFAIFEEYHKGNS